MKCHLIIPSVWVVGMHHWGPKQLSVGHGYILKREPNNLKDVNAVTILFEGEPCAYLKRDSAVFISKLMDRKISTIWRLKPKEEAFTKYRRIGPQQRCNVGCVITSSESLDYAKMYLDSISVSYDVKVISQ